MSLLDPAPSGSEDSNRDAGDGAEPTPDGLANCCRRARRSAKAPRLAGEARVSLGGEVYSAPCRVERRHAPAAYRRRRSVETRIRRWSPAIALTRGRAPARRRIDSPRPAPPHGRAPASKPRPGSGSGAPGSGESSRDPHGLDRYPVTRQSTMLDREEEAATMALDRSASLGRSRKRRLRGPR